MKILLTLAYDGTEYCGWQHQDNGRSVQAALESALGSVFGGRIPTIAASRTDSGVHALGQRVAFSVNECKIPPEKLCYVINKRLPPDITAQKSEIVEEKFNPRFAAKEKTYIYRVWNARYPNPLNKRYAWHVTYPLCTDTMSEACGFFVGRHDFSAFCAAGGSAITFERTVFSCSISQDKGTVALSCFHKTEQPSPCLALTICGEGFLYNMVRIIAGTVVDVGRGRLSADDIPGIIASRDRTLAGQTAPAHGLCLEKVVF
ncbi:MAG: tRNA pseudouridine(38-40) synthase TruA [Defluviitaleaceae bacterium]|nr:tRNA pseudouridine(38-40) synthase TruA [Defluviitaleaceae bacterium]